MTNNNNGNDQANQPRKSSLKPPKSESNDQNGNQNSKNQRKDYDNQGFNDNIDAIEKLDSDNDPSLLLPTNYLETKRKSVVTFSDQTQVIEVEKGRKGKM